MFRRMCVGVIYRAVLVPLLGFMMASDACGNGRLSAHGSLHLA
jgi:hypothetical protein